MINISEEKNCTGCKMCADLCPMNAISFKLDDCGFWYPIIDQSKCCNCGKCKEKCPVNSFKCKNDNEHPKVFSAWSNNVENRITSTSGGVFIELAERIIEDGGVVVGSKYSDDWKSAKHILVNTIEGLGQIKGSKYFQSDTEGIYRKIKEHLNKGKKLLFCGTPCQGAALVSYLGKHYDNLYIVDFICRSINSPKAFKAYLEELEKEYCSKISKVQLKNKDLGWQSLATKVIFENGKEFLKDKDSDSWVRGFIYNDLYTRESCFDCRFRTIPRASSDITLGDFWGIKKQNDTDLFNGISVVLINSSKGQRLFDDISSRITFNESSIGEVFPGNPALKKNPIKTDKQKQFFELLNNDSSFNQAVQKCTALSNNHSIVLKIGKKLFRFKELFLDKGISLPKYIYYNFLCKHVERHGNAKILPHTNTIINFSNGSKIVLEGQNLEIGFNKLKGSHAETHIRLDQNAKWLCRNGGLLFYNTVLEIKENATFESRFFSLNGGSTIIAHKKILFGEDVMIGRNVIIYDSDFHSIYNKELDADNYPKPVVIGNHVWLTTNVMVQKGVTIGDDSLIAAYTVVNKDVPPHCIVGGKANASIISDWVHWSRDTCPIEKL